jgi:hypothetical protein
MPREAREGEDSEGLLVVCWLPVYFFFNFVFEFKINGFKTFYYDFLIVIKS